MNDELFTFDAHEVREVQLRSTGRDFIDWGLHAIMAPTAWQKTKGEHVKVAILDTGVDYNHPDLNESLIEYRDFTDSKTGPLDTNGHGTHVAGIIGGDDNGIGIVGVSPKADLYIGKVLGDTGSGSFNSMIKGLEWAIEKEVDIVNMSLGTKARPPEEFHNLIKKAHAQGIIMVAATGNENSEVCYPALYDEVIAVGAINNRYEKASFSNYGIKNEITAPGVNILSCYKDGKYARISGTSMATPIITGSIALYMANLRKSTYSLIDVEVIHSALVKAAFDLGKEGKDEYYGAGVINLAKLI